MSGVVIEQEPAYQVGARLVELRRLLAGDTGALEALAGLEAAYEALLDEERRR